MKAAIGSRQRLATSSASAMSPETNSTLTGLFTNLPVREIVENADLMALRQQRIAEMRADEAAIAGYAIVRHRMSLALLLHPDGAVHHIASPLFKSLYEKKEKIDNKKERR